MHPIVNDLKELHLATSTKTLKSRQNFSNMKIINTRWFPSSKKFLYHATVSTNFACHYMTTSPYIKILRIEI
jgi:hypothetical protein